MSVDFQVALPRESIQISQVKNVPGLPVRTLDILGQDFRAVDEVLINQSPSPDFVVLSKTRLLAEVPDVWKGTTVTSISVLSTRLTITNRSFISFRIPATSSKVRGILRLMQLFLKVLFTTPGRDIFSPKIGGGALRPLGKNFGSEQGGDIVSSLIVSVDQTTRQIIQIQSRNQSLPPDERLLAATIQSAGFNRNETALVAGIELVSQAGRTALAQLEL